MDLHINDMHTRERGLTIIGQFDVNLSATQCTLQLPEVYRNFPFCTLCMGDNDMHGSGHDGLHAVVLTILYHVF